MRVLVVVAALLVGAAMGCDYRKEPHRCSPTGPGPYPNGKQCCAGKACTYLYTGKEMKECFLASGDDCLGVPDLADPFSKVEPLVKLFGGPKLRKLIKSVSPVELGGGLFKLPASVGSIFHDSCCLSHPDGFFCNAFNQPFASILDPRTNDCPCSMEWRKAVMNLLTGRWWYVQYKHGDLSDHTPTGHPLPPTSLPTSMATWGAPSSHNYRAVQELAKVKAPPGTPLDCPTIDKRCRIGFLRFNKEFDDVDAATVVLQKHGITQQQQQQQHEQRHHHQQGTMRFSQDWPGRRTKTDKKKQQSAQGGFAEGINALMNPQAAPAEDDGTLDAVLRDEPVDPHIARGMRWWFDAEGEEVVRFDSNAGPKSSLAKMIGDAAAHMASGSANTLGVATGVKAAIKKQQHPTHGSFAPPQFEEEGLGGGGGVVAGDSHYCQSGKFKSLHFRLTLLTGYRRWGVCA